MNNEGYAAAWIIIASRMEMKVAMVVLAVY